VPDSADGTTSSFFSSEGGGVAEGVGGVCWAGLGLLSSEPTCSCFWYFFRMDSLWYFQNCFEASFPATLWRTGQGVSEGNISLGRCNRHTLLAARMLLLELGEIVDILVDNDPETVGLVVRRDVGGLVGLRHDGGYVMRICDEDRCEGRVVSRRANGGGEGRERARAYQRLSWDCWSRPMDFHMLET